MESNRALPSSKNSHFQNEARCTTFLVKMSFICMRMKNDFHIKGWAPILVLKQKPGGTRKWPIRKWKNNRFNEQNHAFLHILCRHCTTTTWRCLISRFMEDVDKRQWFFISWSTELKLSIESYFVVFRYELRSKLPEISGFHWRVIQCSFPVPN